MERIIAHLDMDAFFASIEERNTPSFRGKPIVVGADPMGGHGRGVVSTANYKAREYGIHSAMPIVWAWQASEKAKREGKPEVIFVLPDFPECEKSSHNVLAIIKTHSELVEQASIDEFFFDISKEGNYGKAEALCRKIKEEVRIKEKITCSIGLGPNKLIAKIAAGVKKPNGFFIVPACQQAGDRGCKLFLKPLPIRTLPGIGPKTEAFLRGKGVRIIGDLLKYSKDELYEMMGKNGESIYEKSRGIDESLISTSREAKSIGEQETFAKNTLEPVVICDTLKKLSESVFRTFIMQDFIAFKTITVTVRFFDFETKTSSKSFKEGIGKKGKKKFDTEVLRLILPFLDRQKNPKMKQIRLVGVRIERMI